MLVIQKEQMTVLKEYAQQGFEQELTEHVQAFSPNHAEAIGIDAVRSVVRLGIERAETYGLTARGPVRFYVETMCMLGCDFDTDPQLPWAAGVLGNESIKNQIERADILHSDMVNYLNEVAGPEKEHLFEAMRRLSKARVESYEAATGNFEGMVTTALRNFYPQKFNYLGESVIRDLINRGKELASSHAITSSAGAAFLTVLMFNLGHGITTDPLFPWVSQTLADESVADPNERVMRLSSRMKIYLDQTLKNLGQEKMNA